MLLETTLIYNETLIRQAAFAYWRRTIGVGFVLVLLAMTACFVALLMERELSWITGALGTLVGLGFLVSASVYVVHYRNALSTFRRLQDARATFQADRHSFTFQSSIGKSTLQWSAVAEVWKCEHVWLLLFSKAQFSTLPVASLSPELQQLIVSSVEAAGGKIS